MTDRAVARVVRHVRALCRMREAGKAGRLADLSHARRCARLVLQGVLDQGEAEDALALIFCGRSGQDIGFHLWHAADVLARATLDEEVFRYRVEREIKRAVQDSLAAWATPEALTEQARAINTEAGRPFVWPELRRIVEREVTWFVKQRAGRRKHVRG